MKTISLALFAEGPTDNRFLPIIIQRTVERILVANRCPDIGVLEPTPIPKVNGSTDMEKIFQAAKAAHGAHILFVHLDADSRTIEKAREERFNPGLTRIMESDEKLCKDLVPIIPVKNLEAWLICDYAAFCRSVGIRASVEELGLPSLPRLVESLPDPKHTYREALRKAHLSRSRRSRYDPGEYYGLLAQNIDLDILLQVPSFSIFFEELTKTLRKLRLID